jgi:hypothetical protein
MRGKLKILLFLLAWAVLTMIMSQHVGLIYACPLALVFLLALLDRIYL